MDDLTPNTSDISGQPLNRAYNIGPDIDNATDTTEEFLTVTLETIDGAISFYFDNVIKPQVVENGSLVRVPVMYGSPERWKAVQSDGFFRDNKAKIIMPLIMFKRNNVAKNDNISIDKLDANNPQLYYTMQRKHTQKNRYDNFKVLTAQAPVREYYNVVVPDYIIATYDVIIWTRYIKQLNGLIESMVFASDAYWGDKTKWKFRTTVSDIATPVEMTTETERMVRGTFTLTVNGYLLPNTTNKILAQAGNILKKTMSVKKIVLFTEVDDIPVETFHVGTQGKEGNPSIATQRSVILGGGVSNMSASLTSMLQYLNKQFVKQATIITSDTATFTNTTIATPPAEYTPTQQTQENFIFFVNGQYIEHGAITSFLQVGVNTVLTVNTALLGFSFDANDEILAVGKFSS